MLSVSVARLMQVRVRATKCGAELLKVVCVVKKPFITPPDRILILNSCL